MGNAVERFSLELKRREKIENCIKAIDGITYPEWLEVERLINSSFERKIRKFKCTLELSDLEETNKIIRSLFEDGWD